MKKIYILDGSGYIFRSYYGLPELTNEEGKNINCVYGIAKIVIKLLAEKPDGIVIVRDSPVKTFRHEEDANYKANRPKPPEDLRYQYLMVRELIDELWIPNITAPWYEADDVLYTLAKDRKSEYTYYIYTSDKDIKQVLDDNVYIVDPGKFETWNKDRFIKEFGFEPIYMVDYLSLIWDASDNLKWVGGIWPKTAQELISKYNTIDNIYENIGQIAPKLAEKLINWKDVLYQTYKMVKLAYVPDINTDWEKLLYKFDYEKLDSVIKFDSLKKNLKELQNLYKYTPSIWLFG